MPSAPARRISIGLPAGRIASAEEVARTIAFLACDAPFATGTTFALDGGATASL